MRVCGCVGRGEGREEGEERVWGGVRGDCGVGREGCVWAWRGGCGGGSERRGREVRESGLGGVRGCVAGGRKEERGKTEGVQA